jgi:hypothetical protein
VTAVASETHPNRPDAPRPALAVWDGRRNEDRSVLLAIASVDDLVAEGRKPYPQIMQTGAVPHRRSDRRLR